MAEENEINSFLGSILSIKTKPTPDGIGYNIIGTLRFVDQLKGQIVLDEVMKNGEILPNGFVLRTIEIGDLLICGKKDLTSSIEDSPEKMPPSLRDSDANFSAPNQNSGSSTHNKASKENIPMRDSALSSTTKSDLKTAILVHSQSQLKSHQNSVTKRPQNNDQESRVTQILSHTTLNNSSKTSRTPNTSLSLNGSTLMSMFADSMKQKESGKNSNGTALASDFDSPNRSDPKVVYKASDVEQTFYTNARKSSTKSFQQILQHEQHLLHNQDQRTSGSFPSMSKVPPRKDQQNVAASNKGTNVHAPNGNSATGTPPKKGYLNQPQNRTSEAGSSGTQTRYNQNFTQHQHPEKTQKTKQNGGRVQPPRDSTTFEMTTDEIRANEFDFETNLTMFEKLPVTSKRPTKVQHSPHFTSADTTFKVARTIESITLRGIPSEKSFYTATGITIPSVGENVRSSILDLAHKLGISKARTIESMGRSIAQICLPLLGDSFRFSPEREDDRPKVLICAGPHWQGASSVCAARILASQGVQTFVYSKPEEKSLCEAEEKLYRFSAQPVTHDLNIYGGLEFDVVILGIGDELKNGAQVSKYRQFLRNKPVILVDPPLLSSYHKVLNDTQGTNGTADGSCRICITTPNLPLPYATDSGLKIFLVNLGIPRRIYEENNVIYKSPFGDKFVIQIFSAPSSQPMKNL